MKKPFRFQKFEEVVKEVKLTDFPLGDPRRMDLMVNYIGSLHEGYLKSLGWWGRLKYRIKRRRVVKRETKVKLYAIAVYLLAILLGFVLAVGFSGAIGLWPEEWSF